MSKLTPTVATAIFGASDGLVATMALILATESHGRKVVLAASIGLLIAEGFGMAASQYLSDAKRDLRLAIIMGIATSLAIILPAVPWAFAGGGGAIVGSCVIGAVLAGVIAYLRPGGWGEWVQTYGVLISVGAIATLAGRLT
ncbi:MAG TPA: VIT1/CCC1 transporter family protein [Acidimicrobiales bacterium]|nr:VIT1/CCC1 transporter family protein [Acidimicrobiales bacterium]